MTNEKLVFEELSEYDPLNNNMEIVLLHEEKFYHIHRLEDEGAAPD